jgi:hypothetical protein
MPDRQSKPGASISLAMNELVGPGNMVAEQPVDDGPTGAYFLAWFFRSRCASCFARLPHTAMLHQRRRLLP